MKKTRVLSFGVTALQVALILTPVLLEWLAGYKAGVAQHLYYKKISYLSHYYQGGALALQAIVLVGTTALALFFCRKKRGKIFPTCSKYFSLLALLLLFYFLPITNQLYIYAHGLIILQFCLILEVAALIATSPTSSASH